MFSAGIDSHSWCVPWFRVRAGVAKKIRLQENHGHGSSFFSSRNVASEITRKYGVKKVVFGTIF